MIYNKKIYLLYILQNGMRNELCDCDNLYSGDDFYNV
jgi:hypothetical protein